MLRFFAMALWGIIFFKGCKAIVFDKHVIQWSETRLFHDLFLNHSSFRHYNRMIRPETDRGGVIPVSLNLYLHQLIDIDEKSHTMKVSVWLEQIWSDMRLTWNPHDYDGLTYIRIPPDQIWLPEIVLFDNTDGNYTFRQKTNAKIWHTGIVTWKPPGVFKCACSVDVTYFPYDKQHCAMKFGSLSYDGSMVQLLAGSKEIILDQISVSNGEWNIKETHAMALYNDDVTKTAFSHPKLFFSLTLQRLPFYFTVFLIAPCLGISFLTSLVFCLPSESQEKVTLCISVLLAHTFYLLVIAEMMPSSSKTLPLIAEYLLFTLTFITLSIVLSAIVLNIHYRSSITHRPLPPVLRKIIFGVAPNFLLLRKPVGSSFDDREMFTNVPEHGRKFLDQFMQNLKLKGKHFSRTKKSTQVYKDLHDISTRMRKKIKHNQEIVEWKFAATALDRIFFFLFIFISLSGTVVLLVHAYVGSQE